MSFAEREDFSGRGAECGVAGWISNKERLAMTSTSKLPERWVTYGFDGLLEVRSTYAEFDLATMPPLPDMPPGLEWLQAPADDLEAVGMSAGNEEPTTEMQYFERLSVLREQAPEGVPASIWKFLSSAALMRCVPTPTCCYFDMPRSWFSLPDDPATRYLRFMNDQQCVYAWYPAIGPAGQQTIVASRGIMRDDEDDCSPLLDEVSDNDPNFAAAARNSMVITAHDFSEFITRLSIEGRLWFSLNQKRSLGPVEQGYADTLRRLSPQR